MPRWLLWPLAVLAGLALLVVVAAVWGAFLPATHRAARSARYVRPPAEVWAAIADYPGQPSWRPDVAAVERLPDRHGHEVWREQDAHGGGIPYETLESAPPARLVRRIVDAGMAFGGTWTMVLTPDGAGTRLAVTEDGVVRNVVFRFLVHVVFGTTRTMDTYLVNLGKKFGEEVAPQ